MRWLAAAVLPMLLACSPSAPKPGAAPNLSLPDAARKQGIRMPFDQVFLRAFKRENVLELWAANKGEQKLRLVKTYPVAAASGVLGPKRRQGDLQVPEGVYRIDRFNPNSRFHLSLGLDYPNRSDRIRGDKRRPGADIFIHGNQVSIGCLAMTDAVIDEIYPACVDAGNRRSIRVHIFPTRLTDAALKEISANQPEHAAFWKELKPIYDKFEKTRIVPDVGITSTGSYSLRSAG